MVDSPVGIDTIAKDLDVHTAALAPHSGHALLVHTHPESDVAGLTGDLAGKAAVSHTHAEADVISLTTDLAGKDKSFLRYRLVGRYHTSFPDSNGTLALTINRLYAIPFIITDAKTITRIAIHVTILGASAHARLGIYQDNGSIYPGSRISDCGVVDCSAIGMKEITGLSIPLTANTLYWLVLVCDVASTVAAFAIVYLNAILGYPTTALNTVGFASYYVTFSYAALPPTYPVSATLSNAAFPKIAVYW